MASNWREAYEADQGMSYTVENEDARELVEQIDRSTAVALVGNDHTVYIKEGEDGWLYEQSVTDGEANSDRIKTTPGAVETNLKAGHLDIHVEENPPLSW